MASRSGAGTHKMLFSGLLLCFFAQAQARVEALTRRQDGGGATQFHHRAYHDSVIVKNDKGVPYLYIDGGEITTWDGNGDGLQPVSGNGSETTGNFTTVPDRSTYAVSLGEGWTTDKVAVVSISKPDNYPTFVFEALWPDAAGKTFYSYNGALSYALQFSGESDPKPNELWQFTPNGGDGGEWALAMPPPDSNYTALARTTEALQTSHEGLNFALGGSQNSGTDFSWTDRSMDVPGLVMFNETSGQWWNISTGGDGGYSYSGTATSGAAHFVPTFGPEGLLFVFGGYTNDDTLVPFDEAHFFEPVSQQWQKQEVTGTPPSPVSLLCVVGVQGDNGTYEIFLHGGLADDAETTIAQGAVWSLTLPAFHWQQHSAGISSGRYRHSCSMPSDDSRQMIIVGGATATDESQLTYIPPDPWKNSIGVYDLGTLEWSPGYDPDAATYVTPDVIKNHYRDNGLYPSAWTSDDARPWFDKSAAATDDGEQADDASSDTPSSSPQPDAHPKTDTGSNAPTIAGAVIGAVVGLALICFLGWYFWRRRGGSGSENSNENGGRGGLRSRKAAAEIDGSEAMIIELPDSEKRTEVPARGSWLQGRFKAGHGSVYELQSPEEEYRRGSPPQWQEWPQEKHGVTAPPTLVHPSTRNDEWVSPV